MKNWIGNRQYLALGTIAATGIALSNCGAKEDILYTSADKCIASNINPEVCRRAAEDAVQSHIATAPRYRNMVACEMEYGAGTCRALPGVSSTDNSARTGIFTPSLHGFVLPAGIRSMDDYNRYRRRQEEGGDGSGYGSTGSVYRQRNGDLVTPDLAARNKGQTGAMDMKPFNSKTSVSIRGGFGSGFLSGG